MLRSFTTEDDLKLADYIARRCPDPGTGGRSGNVIYHELVQNVRVTNAAVSFTREHLTEPLTAKPLAVGPRSARASMEGSVQESQADV